MPFIALQDYSQRRHQFAHQLFDNSITILPGAVYKPRSGDSDFPFRQNSDFYYLTGFNEENALAVLLREGKNTRYILFNQSCDATQEIWTGARIGQENAIHQYGADEAYPITQFLQKLPSLLMGRDILYFAFGREMQWDRKILTVLNELRKNTRKGIMLPHTIINPEIILHEMRLHKSEAEIALMRQAAQISVKAHLRAMEICRPDCYEYELQAALTEVFLQHGNHPYAYSPIVASGINSCTLHYHQNNRQIANNDLVLIDAGVEIENYSADITRTFPANNKFTAEQKAIYEIVLAAQLAVIAQLKPGTLFNQLQEIAINTITDGLKEIGILKGNTEELIAQKAYLPFYMHQCSHWLGLDTHDVGNYYLKNNPRPLAPGMVLTVEPGIYIAANTPTVNPRWWGIGIRIEDDIAITATGYDILSHNLPKTPIELENLRG